MTGSLPHKFRRKMARWLQRISALCLIRLGTETQHIVIALTAGFYQSTEKLDMNCPILQTWTNFSCAEFSFLDCSNIEVRQDTPKFLAASLWSTCFITFNVYWNWKCIFFAFQIFNNRLLKASLKRKSELVQSMPISIWLSKITFKLSFATILTVNSGFGCDWIRIMPDIVVKLFHTEI